MTQAATPVSRLQNPDQRTQGNLGGCPICAAESTPNKQLMEITNSKRPDRNTSWIPGQKFDVSALAHKVPTHYMFNSWVIFIAPNWCGKLMCPDCVSNAIQLKFIYIYTCKNRWHWFRNRPAACLTHSRSHAHRRDARRSEANLDVQILL